MGELGKVGGRTRAEKRSGVGGIGFYELEDPPSASLDDTRSPFSRYPHSRSLRRWCRVCSLSCPRPTLLGLLGAVALGIAIMLLTWIFEAALFTAVPALASPGAVVGGFSKDGGGNVPAPGPDGKYALQSEGIRATFIPYGASISNLFIKDKTGVERDIVLGFDNATYYSEDESHPHLGGVPGRYANRIKNSSFEIDGTTYHILPNENNGLNTLHGGPDGWDFRNWTVTAVSQDSITFTLFDNDGNQGFPGDVSSTVTYTLSPYTWSFKMTAKALTKKTPIMLTSHTYWNLDGFQNPESATNANWTFSLPYSGQRVGVDGILIPDGTILPNKPGSVNDFWSAPKQIGASNDDPELYGNCGTNCTGYDNCWLVNRAQNGPYDWHDAPVATVSSEWSGIGIEIFSDQDAFQMYSCPGQAGTLALKETQGFFDDASRPRVVEKYGCIVMEVQDWIDGINHPEWQREKKQIFGPNDPEYSLEAVYKFSVNGGY